MLVHAEDLEIILKTALKNNQFQTILISLFSQNKYSVTILTISLFFSVLLLHRKAFLQKCPLIKDMDGLYW